MVHGRRENHHGSITRPPTTGRLRQPAARQSTTRAFCQMPKLTLRFSPRPPSAPSVSQGVGVEAKIIAERLRDVRVNTQPKFQLGCLSCPAPQTSEGPGERYSVSMAAPVVAWCDKRKQFRSPGRFRRVIAIDRTIMMLPIDIAADAIA